MNLLDAGLAPVRRLMSRGPLATCFVCQRPILPSEERMRLRGDGRAQAMRDVQDPQPQLLRLPPGLPRLTRTFR
jgi:hypothetical protein